VTKVISNGCGKNYESGFQIWINYLMRSEAYLSSDRKFRYWLVRIWDESLPIMANWGCNPSTADETVNDPTIRKDMGFSARNGCGGLLKMNAGAYRATKPKDWYKAADPFGPENTIEHMRRYCEMFNVKVFLAAWGKCIGRFASHGDAIAKAFPDMMCLGRTADGTPRHTLMLPYITPMQPLNENCAMEKLTI
jgi:hypothetical protein